MRKLAVAACLVGVLAGAAWASYPEKNIQGYVSRARRGS